MWMYVLQGVHANEAFARKDPHHYGMSRLRQECMEGWIGLIKMFLKKKGMVGKGWLKRIAKFVDLYCFGSIMHNKVDFRFIEKNHFYRQIFIFTDEIRQNEIEGEREMCNMCKMILNKIDQIQLDDQPDEDLKRYVVPMGTRDKKVFESIISYIDQTDDYQTVSFAEQEELLQRNANDTGVMIIVDDTDPMRNTDISTF